MKPAGWVSHPDDVERLLRRWRGRDEVQVEEVRQWTGRPVFAITLGRGDVGILFHKPHAHEPAPCAAMMNVIAQLLDGRGLDESLPPLSPHLLLRRLTITFIPDANPGGTERAPVGWWDGTQYTCEEFWVWMRGRNPETGGMWERYDIWDIRTVEPKPATIGIVYEQVSEHEYVEPNRHHRSSLFRLIFRLLERRNYAALVGLHQTEFVGELTNCEAILPIFFHEQPLEIRRREEQLGQRLVQAWRSAGGTPRERVRPLGYVGQQAEYLRRAWWDIGQHCALMTSEVRNNSLLCPPSLQRRLCEAAIWAGIQWALELA